MLRAGTGIALCYRDQSWKIHRRTQAGSLEPSHLNGSLQLSLIGNKYQSFNTLSLPSSSIPAVAAIFICQRHLLQNSLLNILHLVPLCFSFKTLLTTYPFAPSNAPEYPIWLGIHFGLIIHSCLRLFTTLKAQCKYKLAFFVVDDDCCIISLTLLDQEVVSCTKSNQYNMLIRGS